MRIGERWQLRAGEQLLADLVVTGADQPWLLARFVPTPEFESVRGLFDESLRLSESVADKVGWAAWQRAYDRILDAVSLIDPDGWRVASFLLHIDGGTATWRWDMS